MYGYQFSNELEPNYTKMKMIPKLKMTPRNKEDLRNEKDLIQKAQPSPSFHNLSCA